MLSTDTLFQKTQREQKAKEWEEKKKLWDEMKAAEMHKKLFVGNLKFDDLTEEGK